jgi:hypothetical protein
VNIRFYYQDQVFTIRAPEGTLVHRSSGTGQTTLIVRRDGEAYALYDDQPERLLRLAAAGAFGLELVGSDSGPRKTSRPRGAARE